MEGLARRPFRIWSETKRERERMSEAVIPLAPENARTEVMEKWARALISLLPYSL